MSRGWPEVGMPERGWQTAIAGIGFLVLMALLLWGVPLIAEGA